MWRNSSSSRRGSARRARPASRCTTACSGSCPVAPSARSCSRVAAVVGARVARAPRSSTPRSANSASSGWPIRRLRAESSNRFSAQDSCSARRSRRRAARPRWRAGRGRRALRWPSSSPDDGLSKNRATASAAASSGAGAARARGVSALRRLLLRSRCCLVQLDLPLNGSSRSSDALRSCARRRGASPSCSASSFARLVEQLLLAARAPARGCARRSSSRCCCARASTRGKLAGVATAAAVGAAPARGCGAGTGRGRPCSTFSTLQRFGLRVECRAAASSPHRRSRRARCSRACDRAQIAAGCASTLTQRHRGRAPHEHRCRQVYVTSNQGLQCTLNAAIAVYANEKGRADGPPFLDARLPRPAYRL